MFKLHVYLSGDDLPGGFFDLPRSEQFAYALEYASYIDDEAKEVIDICPAGDDDRVFSFPEGMKLATNYHLGYASLYQYIPETEVSHVRN